MSEELAHGPVGSWMPIWLARMPASPTRQRSLGWSSGLTRSSRSSEGRPKKVRKIALGGRDFTPPYPADTIVEVTSLYSPEALIEIEAIAVADDAAERTP